MMNRFTAVFFVLGLAVLSGCVSTAPKLSPEELNAKKAATLNVYEDNRVVIKTIDQGGRVRSGSVKWSWTDNKDTVLALYVDDSLYNVKDISRITSQSDKNSNEDLVIYFRNGEKKSARAGRAYRQGKGSEYFGPKWVGCNVEKVCSFWYQINQTDPRNRFGETLTAIYDADLSGTSRDYFGAVSFELMKDYRAVPTTPFQEILILDDAGRVEFESKLSRGKSVAEINKAEVEKERKKMISEDNARDAVARQKANKAGQINCTSTSYSCTTSSYSDVTRLECGSFKSSVGEMKMDGWVVANVSSELVRASVGVMCDHNVYHFLYKK